jgi:hypothetical protein
MKSTWPVLLAIVAVTIGAFLYDAQNEAAAGPAQLPETSIAR